MYLENKTPSHRWLLTAELLTVAALILLTLWSVRPLLEEWALVHTFDLIGLDYLRIFAAATPMRPLHLVPSVFESYLGFGRPEGVAVVTAIMMGLRYLAIRWAVTPLLSGKDRWLVASLAAMLFAWPGAWLGRFGPAQLSTALLFIAFGCAIRVGMRLSLGAAAGCVASIVALLCVYQGAALCLLAIPFYMLFWKTATAWRGALRAAAVIAAGFVVYGTYCLVATRWVGGGYEGDLATSSARLLTWTGMRTHVGAAYGSVFGEETLLLPLMLAVVTLLSFNYVQNGRQAPAGFSPSNLALACGGVLTLPLLSLIYVAQAHIQDLERTLFPASVGFVLVCTSLLIRARGAGANAGAGAGAGGPGLQVAAALVVVLLASSVLSATAAHRYALIQKQVIKQTLEALRASPHKAVLVVDTTGILGDVYTLVNPTLRDALAFYGVDVEASICTPSAIDRYHPIARRYPIPTTPRCDQVPGYAHVPLVLTATWDNDRLIVKP